MLLKIFSERLFLHFLKIKELREKGADLTQAQGNANSDMFKNLNEMKIQIHCT